ncbi:TIGR00730 family Rossman fold protein [Burkholderia stagnalis]|uniref:LOG family protein n=1 Tax=Burkholderia stagnalis TaxID=1503054 RepID=UPI000F801B67|nr:TIGR00730 family Rossman fold protein [Burkholderia stagnalis]
MAICVFGGASPTSASRHIKMAYQIGQELARAQKSVIFGGGANGMMGAVASGAVRSGGSVIGILPKFLFDREPPHPEVSDIRVVDSMHARKAMMYGLSEAFLVLPGGFGTLDEAIEVITWRQLSLHTKPIVFVGERLFWAGVEDTFNVMHADGFLTNRDRSLAMFVSTPTEAIVALVDALTTVQRSA